MTSSAGQTRENRTESSRDGKVDVVELIRRSRSGLLRKNCIICDLPEMLILDADTITVLAESWDRGFVSKGGRNFLHCLG